MSSHSSVEEKADGKTKTFKQLLYNIAPDEAFFSAKMLEFFCFFYHISTKTYIAYMYSLEASCRGTSNEYLQHMFL